MTDTTPEADAAFTALFAAVAPAERLRMTCAMFDAAKALVAAGLRAEHPGITPAELRARMFDRLYFGDFDATTHAWLRARLG